MAEKGLDVQDAMDGAGRFHDELVESFLAELEHVPRLPEESESVHEELRQYVGALGNWVRACDQWSFEVSPVASSRCSQERSAMLMRIMYPQSERYFGQDGARIFEDRTL